MTSRKTFTVRSILDKVNHANRHGTQSADERRGQNALLESVLHETGNYKGFSYLPANFVPAGCEPGVVYSAGEANLFPDDTRRIYIAASTVD